MGWGVPWGGGVGVGPWGWVFWGWGPAKGVSISTALAGTEREYKERVDSERASGSAGKRGAYRVLYK